MACGLIVSQAPAAEFRSSGPTTIQELPGFHVDSFFDVFTELSVDGGGLWHIDSFFDVFTELSVGGGQSVPVELTGPVTTRVTRGQEAGTFDTEIVSMSLSGNVPEVGLVTVGQGEGTGEVSRTRVGTELNGDGRFVVDSFFDITYQIEFPGGPASGSGRVEGIPNPGGQRADTFFGQLTPGGVSGGGSGWENPEGNQWFPYPEAPGETWYNQWFYNDPLDMNRQKEIFYDITLVLAPGTNINGPVEVAINWSEPGWDPPASGGPPMAADEAFIGRQQIWFGELEFDTFGDPIPVHITRLPGGPDGPFTLNFNPEWVSIDIRFADGTTIEGGVDILQGSMIWHECVPEPATMSLLALGGLVVLRRRRKR